MASNSNEVYRVVANIPNGFDAVDMRNYFSFLSEKNAFNYFHYARKPETHLMGSILKIQAVVTQFMKDKGFELSERNPKKYFLPAEEVFHSAEGSEHGGDELAKGKNSQATTDNVTKSMSKMRINGNAPVNGFYGNNSTATKRFGMSDAIDDEALTERINFMENDLEASVLRDEDYLSHGSSADREENKEEPQYTILKDRFCCVVRIKKEFDLMFKKFYHQKFWADAKGNVLPLRCLILDFEPLQIVLDYIPSGEDSPMKNRTREQIYEEALHYTHCQMNFMQLFKSNDILFSCGNIGETNRAIEKLLKSYHLNPDKTLLADLGIKFDTNVNVRRFCKVPFYYHPSSDDQDEEGGSFDMTKFFPRAFTANGDVIAMHHDFRQINRVDETLSRESQFDYMKNVEYDASAMDWHTYEEFHDAIQDKEKLRELQFKDDIRLPVTEEGSGVVQYFDGQFWCQNEGGEEIRALDGWELKTEVDTVFRKRLTNEERKQLMDAWAKINGKPWPGNPPKNDKLTDKEHAERKYNISLNALAPYQVKFHIAGMMLLGKVRDPSAFNFPRAMMKPGEVDKEIWNKYFEVTWKEIFKEIEEIKKVIQTKKKTEKKESPKEKNNQKRNKSKRGSKGGRRNRQPAAQPAKKGLNREILERVQRRFDKEARAHPEWYGRSMQNRTAYGKTPLLPGPTYSSSRSYGGKASSRYNDYDSVDYDGYGRSGSEYYNRSSSDYSGNRGNYSSSLLDNKSNYQSFENKSLYSIYDNYGLYEKYYGGNNSQSQDYTSQMDTEMRYLEAQGYTYDSIQAILKRKSYGYNYSQPSYQNNSGMDLYGSNYNRTSNYGGYKGDNYSNYRNVSNKKKERSVKKKEGKKEDDGVSLSSEEGAPAPSAHEKPIGDFTSGVKLAHPQSSCIVKVAMENGATA